MYLTPSRSLGAGGMRGSERSRRDYGDLTQREVAEVLGLRSGATVSAQLHKLAEQVKSDPRLHKEMAEIVAQLKNARG